MMHGLSPGTDETAAGFTRQNSEPRAPRGQSKRS
jgi:hypothetical protein